MSDKNELILNNKMVWKRVTVPGLIESYVTVPAIEAVPTFDWTGPKIPMALWRSILSFFKWSQDTHKCETQVRLFLNTTTGQWRAWAFPQEKGGMTTKEISGTAADEQRAALGSGYQEFGSVHHHCTAGAFQSGTDHTDESNRPGLHITVGNMESKEHSLHSRVTFVHNGRKVMYSDPDLSQWFEIPSWFTTLPPEVLTMLGPEARANAVKRSMISPSTDPFPEIWKANLIERKYEVGRYPYNSEVGGFSYGGSTGSDKYSYGGLKSWEITEKDKEDFIMGLIKICEDHGVDPTDMPVYYDFVDEMHDYIMRIPKITWINGAQIVKEMTASGELDRMLEEQAAIDELKEDQKQGALAATNGHPTQQELDAQGYGCTD